MNLEAIERTPEQIAAAEKIKGCPNCVFNADGDVIELCNPHFDDAMFAEMQLWESEFPRELLRSTTAAPSDPAPFKPIRGRKLSELIELAD